MKNNKSILVVYGSKNPENVYGVKSAKRVAAALRKNNSVSTVSINNPKKLFRLLSDRSFDLILPVGFGVSSAEDGSLSSLSRLLDVPCAGPTPETGVICSDKFAFQAFVEYAAGINNWESAQSRTPKTVLIGKKISLESAKKLVQKSIDSSRLVVKPRYGGSSNGLKLCDTPTDACNFALLNRTAHGEMIIQEYIKGREISMTFLGSNNSPIKCPIIELDRGPSGVMDAELKFGSSAGNLHLVSPIFPTKVEEQCSAMSLDLYKILGCQGVTRFDLIVTENHQIYFLEANPLAGLLESSIAVDAAAAAGISFSDLCDILCETAFPSPKHA